MNDIEMSTQQPPKGASEASSSALGLTLSAQSHGQGQQQHPTVHKTGRHYMPLLIVNYLCLFVGSVSSSLLSKYYFIHKGSSRWVSTWVQSTGFPLLLPPIYLPYWLNYTERRPFTEFTLKLLAFSLFVGLCLGVNNLLFSWGNSYLPVSTSSLLLSTQLVFNLILSVVIVKQKVTFSNLNCVILLTLSCVLLALGSSHDRPEGLTQAKYFIGFFCTICAGKIYQKVYCYAMVMEMQLVMEAAASALAMVGMASDGGVEEMRIEGERTFDRGLWVYVVTVFFNVVTWQLCFMGTAGMIFLTSGLTGGICMTALLAMNVVGGVVVYGDDFGGVKIVSTVLCTWGFCSYAYGLYRKMVLEREGEGRKTGGDGLEMAPMILADGV
ncbi:hypothetical protein CDL15_Pgr026438 [Punica granatum]|uniref:Probable purine permease n=1 Tax=Punica granatum TaxID=22663 RepID=A0A218XI24_PUNGR|nr:hypothetical protein CDL15_Pgr026438 [Punica granatum]